MILDMSMAERIRRTQFLGREFLTWLMFRAARDGGVFNLDGGEVAEVSFERALTLDGDNPAREMTTLKVEEPTDSEEVMLSLRLGKKVSRARLRVVLDGKEYGMVLDGATLSSRSLKLPDTMALEGPEAFAERADMIGAIEDCVHALFVSFAKIRIDHEAWGGELCAIAEWMREE